MHEHFRRVEQLRHVGAAMRRDFAFELESLPGKALDVVLVLADGSARKVRVQRSFQKRELVTLVYVLLQSIFFLL